MSKRKRNNLIILFSFILLAGASVGIYTYLQMNQTGENGEAQIIVEADNAFRIEGIIAFTEDETLLDIMVDDFNAEHTDGFIHTIDGIEQDADAGLYWLYEVNGEQPVVGAGEYFLEDDDTITFTLEQFE